MHAILMFPFFLLELSVFFFNIAVFYLQLATTDLKSALQVYLWWMSPRNPHSFDVLIDQFCTEAFVMICVIFMVVALGDKEWKDKRMCWYAHFHTLLPGQYLQKIELMHSNDELIWGVSGQILLITIFLHIILFIF